jgi:sugar phosphate isomerase/epimerase
MAVSPGKLFPGCQTNAWQINHHEFSTFLHVLEQIQNLQFAGFETGFANVHEQFGNPAARRQMESFGLRFTGIHIFLPAYDPETSIAPASLYQRVVEGGAGLGADRLILSGAPVTTGGRLDEPASHRKTQALMEAARYAQRQGLRFAYHNEISECLADGLEIQALLRETDPSQVGFLLDAGHAYQAGINVPAFFRNHFKRIVGMHLRDYRGGQQIPFGLGNFDLGGLAKAVEQTGWSGWVMAEEDYPNGFKPGSSAIKVARQSIRKTFHV